MAGEVNYTVSSFTLSPQANLNWGLQDLGSVTPNDSFLFYGSFQYGADGNLDNGEVFISKDKIPPKLLAFMYNMSDCTINISDAEGFGLATLESLACETPIIATMTGGLQEQVTDGDEWFGVGLTPASKAVIGSQSVPYIYEDRVCQEDVVDALLKMYNMTKEERQALGAKGRQHVMQNYNFEQFQSNWVELIDSVVENYGSWETRVGYNRWELLEVA